MSGLVLRVEELLRGGADAAEVATGRTLRDWALILIAAGLAYGSVMGSFAGIGGERILQVVYSAAKVPLLLMVSFGASLPSFFVISTLLGVREDFREVLGALVATQARLTLVLLALAPYTAFWYACSSDYAHALLFNGGMFALASFTAQWVLHRRYMPLIKRNRRHRLLLRIWLVIYVFVGIQMAWVLRPFVGDPTLPVQFFRKEAWGNAYEVVGRLIWRAIAD